MQIAGDALHILCGNTSQFDYVRRMLEADNISAVGKAVPGRGGQIRGQFVRARNRVASFASPAINEVNIAVFINFGDVGLVKELLISA